MSVIVDKTLSILSLVIVINNSDFKCTYWSYLFSDLFHMKLHWQITLHNTIKRHFRDYFLVKNFIKQYLLEYSSKKDFKINISLITQTFFYYKRETTF